MLLVFETKHMNTNKAAYLAANPIVPELLDSVFYYTTDVMLELIAFGQRHV